MAEKKFDFLRELVSNVPDVSIAEENAEGSAERRLIKSARKRLEPASSATVTKRSRGRSNMLFKAVYAHMAVLVL